MDFVSHGADGPHNEDLIAVFQNSGQADILILDGRTSVADRDYIDTEAGDVVWLVSGFRDCLKDAIAPGRTQEDSAARLIRRGCASMLRAPPGPAARADKVC